MDKRSTLQIDAAAMAAVAEEAEDKLTPTKCQLDYLRAMVHRCRVGNQICFADGLDLEDVQSLTAYVSEMCCLLRCQPKTLERLCCRSQRGGGRCQQAKCLSVTAELDALMLRR